jgi:transposase
MNNQSYAKYSLKIKENWIELYFSGMSYRQISNYYKDNYPEIQTPDHTVIYRTIKKFQKTGSVEKIKPPGRPLSATNEENTSSILAKISVKILLIFIMQWTDALNPNPILNFIFR